MSGRAGDIIRQLEVTKSRVCGDHSMSDRDEPTDSTWGPVIGSAVFGVVLVLGAAAWPSLMYTTGLAAHLPFKGSDENALPLHPFAELLKLVVAALVGIIV